MSAKTTLKEAYLTSMPQNFDPSQSIHSSNTMSKH